MRRGMVGLSVAIVADCWLEHPPFIGDVLATLGSLGATVVLNSVEWEVCHKLRHPRASTGCHPATGVLRPHLLSRRSCHLAPRAVSLACDSLGRPMPRGVLRRSGRVPLLASPGGVQPAAVCRPSMASKRLGTTTSVEVPSPTGEASVLPSPPPCWWWWESPPNVCHFWETRRHQLHRHGAPHCRPPPCCPRHQGQGSAIRAALWGVDGVELLCSLHALYRNSSVAFGTLPPKNAGRVQLGLGLGATVCFLLAARFLVCIVEASVTASSSKMQWKIGYM